MTDRFAYWGLSSIELLDAANELRRKLGRDPLRRFRKIYGVPGTPAGSLRFTEDELRDECARWAREVENQKLEEALK